MQLSKKTYYIIWIILTILLIVLAYNTQHQKYNPQWNNLTQSNDIQESIFLEETPFKPSSMNISTWILIHPLRYSDTGMIWCSIDYFPTKTWLSGFVNHFLVVDYDQKKVWFHLPYHNYMEYLCDNNDYNNFLLENWFNYKNITPKLEKINKNQISIFYPDYERLEYVLDACDEMNYQPIIEADFDSFVLWTGWMYASDKNNTYIFWRNDIPFSWEALIPNFSVLNNKNWIIDHPYYKIASSWDFDKIYATQKKIENINCDWSLVPWEILN